MRFCSFAAIAVGLCLLVPFSTFAQDGFTFTIVDQEVFYEASVGEAEVLVDIEISATGTPGDTDSFVMGIAHDGAFLDATVVNPSTALTDLNNGDGPDTWIVDLGPAGGPGVTIDVAYSEVLGDAVLSFESDTVVVTVHYDALDLEDNRDGYETDLTWSDGLGDPALVNEIMTDPDAFTPTLVDGTVTLTRILNPFTFSAESASGTYNPTSGVGSGCVEVSILEDADSEGFPSETQGFQMSLGHDSEFLVPTSVTEIGILADLDTDVPADDEADGPDFIGADLNVDNGIVIGVVYSLTAGLTLAFEEAEAVLEVCYDTVADEFIDDEVGRTIDIEWVNGLGVPPIDNGITIDEALFDVEHINGSLELLPSGENFLRGDVDGNGVVFGLIDVLGLLEWAFTGGTTPPCMKSADADDNGVAFALIDGIYLLTWAFVGGVAPPDPGPTDCGPDPTPDSVSCDTPLDC